MNTLLGQKLTVVPLKLRACLRMREALTYLAHAYESNATLLKNGEKRGMEQSVIAVYRRKCLTVSLTARTGPRRGTADSPAPPLSARRAGAERGGVASVLQRRRQQRGRRHGHHGRGGHPLPALDEPRPGAVSGGPGRHGEHPQPLVLLPQPRHGR